MPSVDRPGKKGVYIEFDLEFLSNVQEFAQSRGESFREVVVLALRRHMANPPPPPVPIPPPPLVPLPPLGTPSEAAAGPTKPTVRFAPKKKGKK